MENTYDSVLKYFDKYIMEKQPDEVERDRWLDHFGHDDYILFALAYAAKFQAAPARIVGEEEIEAAGIEGGLRDNELQLFWEGAKWALSRQTAIVQDESNKRIDALKLSLAKMLKTYVYDLDADGNPKASVSEIMAMLEEVNNNL